MFFTDDLKNVAVDAMDTAMAHMSLHTDYSASGANEVSGGSYARQATARDASSGGEATLTATESFSVPATTVRWVGWWSASSGGTFYGMAPNYSGANVPRIFFGESTDDVITSPAHGLSDTDTIVFVGASLPSGITQGTTYFVRDATTDTFKIAATSGGSAIDLTADGRGVWARILAETYAAPGTHNITAAPLSLNLLS